MRGSRFLLVALLSAGLIPSVPAWPVAQAQGQVPVIVRLRSQSAWNGARRPLVLSFTATNNTGQPLGDLSVVLSIGTATLSRSAFEQSLRADQTAFPFALPFDFDGALAPGETRTFAIRHPLTSYPHPGQSGLYPIKIQLLSADLPQATLRTAMVFLVEKPEFPLNLSWTWVLDTPVQRAPDGSFRPGVLPEALAAGGRIDAQVSALDAVTPIPVDIAVSPVLADQLEAMAGGYRADVGGQTRAVPEGTAGSADAARILSALQIVMSRPGVELVALPFGDAVISSLIRSGLAGDAERLLQAGRDRLVEVLSATPDPTVFRPPLSQIEPGAASALAKLGVRTLLVDPGTIPVDPDLPFAPPAGSARPVVRLPGSLPMFAVTPDPGVASIAAAYPDDPRLAAQAALAELAAVWLEFPGTPGRGASLVLPENAPYQAAFYGLFAQLVAGSPWLLPTQASDLVSSSEDPPTATLPARSFRALSRRYRQSLLGARRAVAQFDQAVDGGSDVVSRLQSNLLLAEGEVALSDPGLGSLYIASARQAIEATYRQIRPPPSGFRFTLTSKGAAPPLTVSNESRYPMRIVVRLVSNRRLLFPTGNIREVTLRAKSVTLVRIPVRAAATGRFPMKVQILTGGTGPRALIAESDLIIRSTAYNRIALYLTIGAAGFLLAWWARGVLHGRRKRAGRSHDVGTPV